MVQPKLASEYDVRCGYGLLQTESASWPNYSVVTTPQAYEAAHSSLLLKPSYVALATSKDFRFLDKLSDGVPTDVEIIVGIGGGSALDASKYIALKRGLPLILAPTILSSLVMFHGKFPIYDGRNPIDWHWHQPVINCEHMIVDYTVVLQAPEHFNTAGLGDILCDYAGLAEWRHNSLNGTGIPWDDTVASHSIKHHESIISQFPSTINDLGLLSKESIKFIVDALKARDDNAVSHSAAWSGEHALAQAIELVNDKSWVHGELVALCALIIAWKCDQFPEVFASQLDKCRIRWRPEHLAIDREELRRGLYFVPRFMADQKSGRDLTSILRSEPIKGAMFKELWEFLV